VASSELIWHPAALAEAEEARDWYAARSPMAARGFLLALEEAVNAVAEAPERWPKHRYGCRRHVFPNRYPYTLIYRFAADLEIVAVAHQKRRPGYWKHRL
jgi:plasmid stabilization system protein ParE